MIGKDKIKHIAVGIGIYAIAIMLTNHGEGLFYTCLIAILKETNDKYRVVPLLLSKVSTGFSFADVVATIAIPTLFTILNILCN